MSKNFKKDYQKEFKLNMYKEFWSNVRRAEDSSWKIFVSYSIIIGVISFLYLNNIPSWIICLLITGLTGIAISISLNANLWFLRNMVLITLIERVFEPYDVIPEKWKKFDKKFFNDEIWTLHILLYLIIGITICSFFLSNISSLYEIIYLLIGLIFIIGLVLNHTKLLMLKLNFTQINQ